MAIAPPGMGIVGGLEPQTIPGPPDPRRAGSQGDPASKPRSCRPAIPYPRPPGTPDSIAVGIERDEKRGGGAHAPLFIVSSARFHRHFDPGTGPNETPTISNEAQHESQRMTTPNPILLWYARGHFDTRTSEPAPVRSMREQALRTCEPPSELICASRRWSS